MSVLILIIGSITIISLLSSQQVQRQRKLQVRLKSFRLHAKLPERQLTLVTVLLVSAQRIINRLLPQAYIVRLKQDIVTSQIKGYTIERHFLSMAFYPIIIFTALYFSLAWPLFIKLAIAFVFALAPGMTLRNRIKYVHQRVVSELPQYINLLRVCIEAGLDLESAFSKLTDKYSGFLLTDTKKMLDEAKLGKPFHDALQDMAERINLPEFTAIVSLMVQSASLGVSISSLLKIQSESVLLRYIQSIRERTAKIPVMITVPMVFFILPALFLVVLGPAIINIRKMGMF